MDMHNAATDAHDSQLILRFAVAMTGLAVVGCFIAASLLTVEGDMAAGAYVEMSEQSLESAPA